MLNCFEKPARDAKYLNYIRKQECCLCHTSNGVQAHHVGNGGMGQKTSDYNTVPLCLHCHGMVHNPPSKIDSKDLKAFLKSLIEGYQKSWQVLTDKEKKNL
jgi:hypothetical protein